MGILNNVAEHLLEQNELHKLKYNIDQLTSEATEISLLPVKCILAEGKGFYAKGNFILFNKVNNACKEMMMTTMATMIVLVVVDV